MGSAAHISSFRPFALTAYSTVLAWPDQLRTSSEGSSRCFGPASFLERQNIGILIPERTCEGETGALPFPEAPAEGEDVEHLQILQLVGACSGDRGT